MKQVIVMGLLAMNKGPAVSAQANLREQVKARSGGRSQNLNAKEVVKICGTVASQANFVVGEVKRSGCSQSLLITKELPA